MTTSRKTTAGKAAAAATDAPIPRSERGRRRTLLLQQIIEGAGVVFADRGVTNTSLQDVADHLGVSRAALYYHVSSREHLLRLVLGSYISLYREWLHDLRERADLTPEQRLREAMRILTRGFHTHPHLSRIFLRAETEFPEDVAIEQRRSRRGIHREVELIVIDGVQDGSFVDVDADVVTFAIFGMINWMHVWYVPGGRLTAEEVADGFTEIVLGGIRKSPSRTDDRSPLASIARMKTLLEQLEKQVATGDESPSPRRRVQRGA